MFLHHSPRRIALLFGALLPLIAACPLPASDAYWVFLKDKALPSDLATRQALADLTASCDPASLARRQLRGLTTSPFTTADLPVAPAYLQALQSTGVTIRQQSTWLNAVSVSADSSHLAAIAALPFVDHLQPVATLGLPQATLDVTAASTSIAKTIYGSAFDQLEQLKIPEVHALGYTGANINIGILDTGFKRTHEAFNDPSHPLTVLAEHDFIKNTTDTSSTVNGQHLHGTYILGTIGAYKPNTYIGAAYNASFLLAKTEVVPTETQIEEDYWVSGLEWLESHGADLVTSSLGYIDWYSPSQLDGHTAVTTLAASAAASRGLFIINAAGNEGHDSNPATNHLIAPADADLLITVGAADLSGNIASFSSDGPTADGRLKPEVLACGVSTQTVNPNSDTNYVAVSGTSLSTPLIASTVALLIEAHPDWTVPQLRSALFATASDAANPDPLFIHGYGIVNALAALNYIIPGTASPWRVDGNGSWSNPDNWLGPVPQAPDAKALLGSRATLPRTVTLDAGITVGHLIFSNSHPYTIAATDTSVLFLQVTSGSADITVQSGSHLIAAPLTLASPATLAVSDPAAALTLSGPVTGPGFGLTKTGPGTLQLVAANSYSGGTTVDQGTLIFSGPAARPAGDILTLNKTSGQPTWVIIGGDASNLDNYRAALHNSFDPLTATWTNSGDIRSASAALAQAEGIGYLTGLQYNQFHGTTLDPTTVLLRYTWLGDANLDGILSFDDYLALDAGYLFVGSGYASGDFNYDGLINASDYALIDFSYLHQSGPLVADPMLQLHASLFGPDYLQALAALGTSIPEPASLALLAFSATALLVRRRN